MCTENNWSLINPPTELSNKVEEKISQLEWLGELRKYLPEYSVKLCKNIEWEDHPFIIQFNRSHTGSGTILIQSTTQLKEVQEKFPEREARTAKYVPGPLFTNNNIVTKDKTLVGNISYQLTGLKPFTDREFATIGIDWGYGYLTKEQKEGYLKIAVISGVGVRRYYQKLGYTYENTYMVKNLYKLFCQQIFSICFTTYIIMNTIYNIYYLLNF